MTSSMTVQLTKQILVVEDDEDSRRALTNVLEDEGFSVAAVGSGQEALDYLHDSARPQLIVLDLMMPGMKGWNFRHLQKQDPELAAIPGDQRVRDGQARRRRRGVAETSGLRRAGEDRRTICPTARRAATGPRRQ
jgi:CheY-like chemotaxis protein